MNITCLCLTYNRDKCLQRALKFFINQDYQGSHTLLVFNTGKPTTFPEFDLPENKEIILINQDLDGNGKPFTSVGSKYNEALLHIPENTDAVSIFDNDDQYLPNHITEGVKGLTEALAQGKVIYKPLYSYFKDNKSIHRMNNVFEPSMFIDFSYMKEKGFTNTNVHFHGGYLYPAIENNQVYAPEDGVSTFCYDWSQSIPTYKMSGRPDNNENFILSQITEKDYGNGVTTPISDEEANKYYEEILKS